MFAKTSCIRGDGDRMSISLSSHVGFEDAPPMPPLAPDHRAPARRLLAGAESALMPVCPYDESALITCRWAMGRNSTNIAGQEEARQSASHGTSERTIADSQDRAEVSRAP